MGITLTNITKKLFHVVENHLFRAILKYRSIPFRAALLKKYGWRIAQVTSLQSACESQIKVSNETSFVISGPQWYRIPANQYMGTYPEIKAHLLKDAIVSAYSAGVVRKDHLLLPVNVFENWDRFRTVGAAIFKETPSEFLVAAEANIEIPQAIHAGGAGAFNWYHFVVECLPKIYLTQLLPTEFDNVPLLVPDECILIPSFRDAVKVFSGNRPLIPLSKTDRALVGQLIIFDEVSFGPFNMINGEWPQISDYSQNEEILKAFIDELRSHFSVDKFSKVAHRKIFLARPGVRRNYNQGELLEIARKYGIEPVYLENLSLSEQAEVFAEASVIIGPSGAAWTGMIFSERPFVGLSWLPSGYKEFSSYSTLANLLGHQLTFIEAKPHHELVSTSDAYGADYSVSAREFEDAIHQILGN